MTRTRRRPAHLERRGQNWHWRRRVPLGARKKIFGKSFLSFSLRTDLLRDAEILARRLTALSDAIFAHATETTMVIAPDIAETLLTALVRFEIEAFERARALADLRSPDAAEADLRREEALQATLRRALFLGDRDIARAPLAHVAERLGIVLDDADRDWKALAYEATKVLLDVSEERHRRSRGLYTEPTPVFRRALGRLPDQVPSGHSSAAPARDSGLFDIRRAHDRRVTADSSSATARSRR